MKNFLLSLLFVLFSFSYAISQDVATIWISSDDELPMKVVVFDKSVYVLTFEQVKILSTVAASGIENEKLANALRKSDEKNRRLIQELKEKVEILEENYEAAISNYKYEAEKSARLKILINDMGIVIEEAEKEIRRLKRASIALSILSALLVVALVI